MRRIILDYFTYLTYICTILIEILANLTYFLSEVFVRYLPLGLNLSLIYLFDIYLMVQR